VCCTPDLKMESYIMNYFVFLFIILISSLALSDDFAAQRNLDRLDRLERDMNLLQGEFFRKPAKESAPKLSRKERAKYPKLEIRLDEIEDQMRKLHGKFEEVDFRMVDLAKKLDKIIADIDMRIEAVEMSAKKPDPLDLPDDDSLAIDIIPDDPNASHYDIAFEFMRKSDYEKAAESFRRFIENNEDSELISNAYYWLGETYYVRKKYEKSAVNFLNGYKKLPKGEKAADNLVKLAMSLKNLKKKKEACTTFKKAIKEFPKIDSSLKERIKSEKNELGCK